MIESLEINLKYQKSIERELILELGITRDKIRKLTKQVEEYHNRQSELPYWRTK